MFPAFAIESYCLRPYVRELAAFGTDISVATKYHILSFYAHNPMQYEIFLAYFCQHGHSHFRVSRPNEQCLVTVVFKKGPHTISSQWQGHGMSFLQKTYNLWNKF